MKLRVCAYTFIKWVRSGVFIAIFAPIFIQAQPHVQWVSGFASTGSSNWCWAATSDPQSNSYIVGYYDGTVDFDPGPAILNITVANYEEGFICKLDPWGNLVWVKTIRGVAPPRPHAVVVNPDGDIYIVGTFNGTTDFDPGPGVYNLSNTGNNHDAFVLKLDAAGNFLWARGAGNYLDEKCLSVSTDEEGNCYALGGFGGIVDFDPGPDTLSVTGSGAFLWKLRPDGTLAFVRTFANISNGSTAASSVWVNNRQDVILSGNFTGTVDFDPGAGLYNLSGGGGFVCKLDTGGSFIWAKAFTGVTEVGDNALAEDREHSIYFAGSFSGIPDFDPGPGVYNLASNGSRDIYVVKIDSMGNFVYARSMGGAGYDEANGIAVDTTERVYLCGRYFSSPCDFDPGPGLFQLNAQNSGQTGFVMRLMPNGSLDWVYSQGALGYNMTAAPDNAILCAGFVGGPYDMDPGPDTIIIPSTGSGFFALKLHDPCVTPGVTVDTTVCGQYIAPDGIIYSGSGTYNAMISNINGCDSAITIHLTVQHPDISVLINQATIISNASGATYQWLNCDSNMSVIPGAVGQSYTAETNGHFAVIINNGTCVDTSLCYAINVFSGLDGYPSLSTCRVYPNPSSETINLYTDFYCRVDVYDVSGIIKGHFMLTPGNTPCDISSYAPGCYYLRFADDGSIYTLPLIILGK